MKTISETRLSEEDKKKGFRIITCNKKAAIMFQNIIPGWMEKLEDKEYDFLVRDTMFGKYWLNTI